MEKVKPGERTLEAPLPCPHQVFASLDKEPSGAEYVLLGLNVEISKHPPRANVLDVDANIVKILKKYFRFDDGIAFAQSEAEREAARLEVSAYLGSLGYQIPE